jgi:hypothetical protein
MTVSDDIPSFSTFEQSDNRLGTLALGPYRTPVEATVAAASPPVETAAHREVL